MPTSLDRRLIEQLADQERRGLTRFPPPISKRQGVRYHLDDHPVVGFCSNDYLGLANHPYLRRAPIQRQPVPPPHASSVATFPSTVRRGPPRRTRRHRVRGPVSERLSAQCRRPPALIEPHDPVHSDALNHASLIDGLRLSRARSTILPTVGAPPSNNSWWVTEALFSMDGDYATRPLAPNPPRQRRRLYLDEAHSFGLFTHQGRVTGSPAIRSARPSLSAPSASPSDAPAPSLAASTTVCRGSVVAHAASSTAPASPLLAAQMNRAIDLVDGPRGRHPTRSPLGKHRAFLAARLGSPNLSAHRSSASLGPNDRALTSSAPARTRLARPGDPSPDCARGTSRLRITVTAGHTPDQIDAFADDLRELALAITFRCRSGRRCSSARLRPLAPVGLAHLPLRVVVPRAQAETRSALAAHVPSPATPRRRRAATHSLTRSRCRARPIHGS
jgi:8-amino-7-oxononanoate synthase